jgi:hypothetical protein
MFASMRLARAAGITTLFVLVAACSSAGASPEPPAASQAAVATPGAEASPSASPSASLPSPTAEATPRPRPSLDVDLEEVAAYLTAGITLLDLAETAVAVDVSYLDPSSGEPFPVGTYTLEPEEQLSNSVPPGTYELTFHQPASSTGAACTIEVGETDTYVFASLGDAVAVTRAGETPGDATELFIATSSLCRAGVTS